MEIKHYTLYQGLKRDIPFTYVRLGDKSFYLRRETWNNVKTFCTILLTSTITFAIV